MVNSSIDPPDAAASVCVGPFCQTALRRDLTPELGLRQPRHRPVEVAPLPHLPRLGLLGGLGGRGVARVRGRRDEKLVLVVDAALHPDRVHGHPDTLRRPGRRDAALVPPGVGALVATAAGPCRHPSCRFPFLIFLGGSEPETPSATVLRMLKNFLIFSGTRSVPPQGLSDQDSRQ